MKLYEYKAKAMTLLLNYQPKSQRERELVDLLMRKLSELRGMTLPRLLFDVHLIINHEPQVSDEFKALLRQLVPKEQDIEEMVREA